MKKERIYTLLCAAVMIPSISLAAENSEKEITQAVEKKKKEILQDFPNTPDIKAQQKQKIMPGDNSDYSPTTQKYLSNLVDVTTNIERQKKYAKVAVKLTEYESNLKLEAQQKKEEERKVLEQKRSDALIQQTKLAANQAEQEKLKLKEIQESLTENISKLQTEMEKLKKKLTSTESITKYTQTYLEQMQKDWEEKEKEVQELTGKLYNFKRENQLLNSKLSTEREQKESYENVLNSMIGEPTVGEKKEAPVITPVTKKEEEKPSVTTVVAEPTTGKNLGDEDDAEDVNFG